LSAQSRRGRLRLIAPDIRRYTVEVLHGDEEPVAFGVFKNQVLANSFLVVGTLGTFYSACSVDCSQKTAYSMIDVDDKLPRRKFFNGRGTESSGVPTWARDAALRRAEYLNVGKQGEYSAFFG
jgi:hypothetical protein